MARLVEPFQPQQCRERLLARRPEGVFVKRFERGGIASDLFRAVRHGLEGLVSKHRDIVV
jgi:hypothetical protein